IDLHVHRAYIGIAMEQSSTYLAVFIEVYGEVFIDHDFLLRQRMGHTPVLHSSSSSNSADVTPVIGFVFFTSLSYSSFVISSKGAWSNPCSLCSRKLRLLKCLL